MSGVAHELNNPLSVVIGHGQLMLSRNPPPEVRRPVELIVSQGERMAKIVQGLLLFSRQRATVHGAVRLPEIVEQTLFLRAAQLRLSSIDVSAGQTVEPGQLIGRVGSTGLSSGPHLHWEARIAGTPVDPRTWLTSELLP